MSQEEEPKVQEIPESEDVAEDAEEESGMDGHFSRAEKKARRVFSKLGLKQFPGVKKVVVKRVANQILFVVNSPDVYRNPGTETYVIFGAASTAGDEQASLAQAAQQLSPEILEQLRAAAAGGASAEAGAEIPDVEEDEEVDTTGIEEKDIALVMEQAKVSRAKAAKTLKANNGDVVNAIMELSM